MERHQRCVSPTVADHEDSCDQVKVAEQSVCHDSPSRLAANSGPCALYCEAPPPQDPCSGTCSSVMATGVGRPHRHRCAERGASGGAREPETNVNQFNSKCFKAWWTMAPQPKEDTRLRPVRLRPIRLRPAGQLAQVELAKVELAQVELATVASSTST